MVQNEKLIQEIFQECLEFASECSREEFLSELEDAIHMELEILWLNSFGFENGSAEEQEKVEEFYNLDIDFRAIANHLIQGKNIPFVA